MPGKPWTESDDEYLRAHYGKGMTAKQIGEQLGGSVDRIRSRAWVIGLAGKQADFGPDFEAFVREKNAIGWSDTEIAAAWKCDRHAVNYRRKRLGLPENAHTTSSEHFRNRVRKKTQEQIEAAGVKSLGEIRAKAYREFAIKSGWPEDLRPRAVQILNTLWKNGPQTRKQLAAAIGMPWKGSRKSLHSNDPEGSYLAHLIKRGLVIALGRIVRGKGRGFSTQLYSIPLGVMKGSFNGSESRRPAIDTGTGQRSPSPMDSPNEGSGSGGDHGERHHGDREEASRTRKGRRRRRDQVCV